MRIRLITPIGIRYFRGDLDNPYTLKSRLCNFNWLTHASNWGYFPHTSATAAILTTDKGIMSREVHMNDSCACFRKRLPLRYLEAELFEVLDADGYACLHYLGTCFASLVKF